MAMLTGGLALDALLEAMEANLHGHVSFLQRQVPVMYVHDSDGFLLVDSGLASDTFNKICRARLQRGDAAARIAEAIGYFRRVERPFAWWVGPCSTPDNLAALLEQAGLCRSESEIGMAADLAALPASVQMPDGLAIRRVATRDELLDFAAVNAANWNPPDPYVIQFFALGADILLQPDCPMRLYVGYLDETAVASAETFLGGGVAGIHMVSTRREFQRRGIGLAMTWAAANAGRQAGMTTATLQASAEGQGVYERLGFRACCEFVEWQ